MDALQLSLIGGRGSVSRRRQEELNIDNRCLVAIAPEHGTIAEIDCNAIAWAQCGQHPVTHGNLLRTSRALISRNLMWARQSLPIWWPPVEHAIKRHQQHARHRDDK